MHSCKKNFICVINCTDIVRIAMKSILLEHLREVKQNEIGNCSSRLHSTTFYYCSILF